MKRLLKASIIPLGLSLFIVILWFAVRGSTIDVLMPTGHIALEQRKILYFTLALSLLVVIPVFTMLGIFAYKYREGNTKSDYKPEWGSSNKLEAIWWGIPFVIIAILGTMTWQTTHSLDPYRPIASNNKTIEVQVVALQWKWLFIYPDLGIATVNELPLPVNHPVHFTLAADAPMSAFWIPSLGSQTYSMNGMSSQLYLMANKIGNYTGYNTNINGQGYAKMTFNTRVMSHEDFSQWQATASQSSNTFGMSNYESLVKPGLIESPRTYRLSDMKLYDTIVAKYMDHGHGAAIDSEVPVPNTTNETNNEDATMDHSQMDHSTMNHEEHH